MTDIRVPAFTGTFSDIKSVKTRGVVQIIVEMPIEQAAAVIAAWGFPQPSSEIPIALAKMSAKAPAPSPDTDRTPEKSGGGAKKPSPDILPTGPGEGEALVAWPNKKRSWDDVSYSQQAGIRSNDDAFRRFLEAEHFDDEFDLETVAVVRNICGVKSRSEIVKGTPAGDKWHDLDLKYRNWLGDHTS